MPKSKLFSQKTWDTLKFQWCKGDHRTVEQLCEWAEANLDRAPARNTILNRMSRDGDWNKVEHNVKGLVDQEVATRITAIFEEQGFRIQEAVNTIIRGARTGEKEIDIALAQFEKQCKEAQKGSRNAIKVQNRNSEVQKCDSDSCVSATHPLAREGSENATIQASIAESALNLADRIRAIRRDQAQWIDQFVKMTGQIAPTKKVIEIDMEAKWRVAQSEIAGADYRKRFGHPATGPITQPGIVPNAIEVSRQSG